MYDERWKPYVPVAQRRAQAAREVAKRSKKGQPAAPVVIEGRVIAKTFWGKAWCDNLERYSDYSNRLPRGRTYVRNGSVVDLQIGTGSIRALVSGSELYEIEVKVAAVPTGRWQAVCRDCAGAIDSLIELLQGQFSKAVMERMCQEKTGLFPSPAELTFKCSCPDWASMCKHVAAVLYGIGARLDEKPDLLFALRNVNHKDLIAEAGAGLAQTRKRPNTGKVLDTGDLSEIFGIEMAQPAEPDGAVSSNLTASGRKKVADRTKKRTADPSESPGIEMAQPAEPHKGVRRTLTDVSRKKISDHMKRRWAEMRKGKTKKH
jgi:uncharacterized Zn finger protein